jgi:hypothetical protein
MALATNCREPPHWRHAFECCPRRDRQRLPGLTVRPQPRHIKDNRIQRTASIRHAHATHARTITDPRKQAKTTTMQFTPKRTTDPLPLSCTTCPPWRTTHGPASLCNNARMRRRAAVTALVVTAMAVVLTVIAAVDAAHGRHVALRPLNHPFLAGFLAAVVTIVALRSLMPEGTLRLLTQAGAGALGLLVGAVGLVDASEKEYEPHAPKVVAEDRSVQVIAWQITEVGSGRHVLLRLRTRDGLFSRDGTGDLGCFIDGPVPKDEEAWAFSRATLAGGDTLLVHTTAGEEWQVRFNPKTLRPLTPMIDRCTTAPGSNASPVPTTTN